MKNSGLLMLLAAAGLYFYFNKSAVGIPVASLTTDQKRKSIISWWETATPPNNQAEDNGRFIDIISNISGNEIDVIYDYVFNYVVHGTRPASGSTIANAMQTIITNYQIFT